MSFDAARETLREWNETVALLRRLGMLENAAIEAAGILLADRWMVADPEFAPTVGETVAGAEQRQQQQEKQQ